MDWSEAVGRAVALGEQAGDLTFGQINDLMSGPEQADLKDVDALLTLLSALGIVVTGKE